MSGDWVSIWELAQRHWPQKPRFYASRLLNYSILNDLPRKVGDVLGAIGGDTERLYNISVNSPNVDRISREVFLSLPLVRSHLESRRFNPEERYLPRRPRQEEYLISKPATPFTFLPVGDGSMPVAEEERLSYFARMGVPYGVTRKKKIPVALDYRQNLLLDRDMPPIREMARKRYPEDAVELPDGAEPPSRLGCINSEEALLWNVFRTLIRENGMKHFLGAPTLSGQEQVGEEERISAAWFWGMNDRGSTFLPLVHASEAMGEPADRRTVPDLILLGINHFLVIEARLATTFSSCPWLKHDQCPGTGACHYWTAKNGVPKEFPAFVVRADVNRTCGRHFQLMRLHMLIKTMSAMPSMGEGKLVAIIDEGHEAGSINRRLFVDFMRNLEPAEQQRLVLTSWQKVKSQLPNDPKFEELHREFREKWGF
jgi:hypothetical protein